MGAWYHIVSHERLRLKLTRRTLIEVGRTDRLADMCPRFHEVVYTVGQFMFDIVHCPLTGIERLDFIQKKIRQLAKIFSFTYDHDLWKKELDKPGNMFKDKELVALLKGCLKRPEVLGESRSALDSGQSLKIMVVSLDRYPD